ncbi:MAG TPA: NAD(P)/FAD-dependent oxidoreductase [Thermoplasmata archaeon]|nr:NAD(P)/FAD-dependent oxidoreductase [Thermoplasmata archaeon]
MVTMEEYDVLVVGAGPAGSSCAKAIAEKADKSVLLIEKRQTPASACAGGIPAYHLEKLGLSIPKEVILEEIHEEVILSPSYSLIIDESIFDSGPAGFIINRKKFDQWLIKEAISSGVEYRNNTDFLHVKDEIKAKVCVDASGVSRVVGKANGFQFNSKPNDLGVGLQYTVDLPDSFDPHRVYFYLNAQKIPRGYFWIFPINEKRCKIGVGIAKATNAKLPAIKILNKFATDLGFKIDTPYERLGGLIPLGRCVKSTQPNIFLIGDAGNYCSPLTGEGIYYAIKSGRIAGEVIAFDKGVKFFNKLIKKSPRKSISWQYRAKRVFYSLNNKDLDGLVKAIGNYEIGSLNLKKEAKRALFHLLKRDPKLCLRLIRKSI